MHSHGTEMHDRARRHTQSVGQHTERDGNIAGIEVALFVDLLVEAVDEVQEGILLDSAGGEGRCICSDEATGSHLRTLLGNEDWAWESVLGSN